MMYIISNFLVLHFGEYYMKIQTKIAKLQIHENLHKNVNENMFSFTFLYKFSRVILLILIYLKWRSSSFRIYQFFQNLMVQMIFS